MNLFEVALIAFVGGFIGAAAAGWPTYYVVYREIRDHGWRNDR